MTSLSSEGRGNINPHLIKNQQGKKFAQISEIGNTYFYRCLLSQPLRYFGTQSLIIIGMVLYYIFTAKFHHPILIAFTTLFHIIVFIDLVILAFRDPGIIPRIFPGYENTELGQIPFDSTNCTEFEKEDKRFFVFTQKTHLFKLKFCNQCCIYRPPRTTHCYDCNICVKRFDHHCPWIGTCIGQNNYINFYIFLAATFILTILGLIQAVIGIVMAVRNRQTVEIVVNSILSVYCFLGFGFVGIMVSFHTYLSNNNITTNEYCKETWQILSGNPFHKSNSLKNVLKLFDYPFIVIYDPEVRLRQREKVKEVRHNFREKVLQHEEATQNKIKLGLVKVESGEELTMGEGGKKKDKKKHGPIFIQFESNLQVKQ